MNVFESDNGTRHGVKMEGIEKGFAEKIADIMWLVIPEHEITLEQGLQRIEEELIEYKNKLKKRVNKVTRYTKEQIEQMKSDLVGGKVTDLYYEPDDDYYVIEFEGNHGRKFEVSVRFMADIL